MASTASLFLEGKLDRLDRTISSPSSVSASSSHSPLTLYSGSSRASTPPTDFRLSRPSSGEVLQEAIELIRREAEAVAYLADRLEGEASSAQGFSRAIDLLAEAHEHAKLVVTGLGKSALVGRKAVATLCSLGIPAVFVDPIAALHGDIGVVNATGIDVALVISFSGRTAELQRLLPILRARCKGGLIALTGDPAAPLSQAADVWLDGRLHDGAEADVHVPAPSASVLVALSQLDALALCLLRIRIQGGWHAPGDERAAHFAHHHEELKAAHALDAGI